jgi:hypothetical protein
MAARTEGRYRTPRPDPEVERRSIGSGPVTTYYLSKEELEKLKSSDRTRTDYLIARAAGSTIAAIEKSWGMKLNTLPAQVYKWKLKGVTPEKAKQILEEDGHAEEDQPAQEGVQQAGDRVSPDRGVENQAGESQDGQGAGSAAGEDVDDIREGKWMPLDLAEGKIKLLRAEVELLKHDNKNAVESAEMRQAEVDRLRHVLEEKINETNKLYDEADGLRAEIHELEELNAGLHKELNELREDRLLLLSTIEKSAASAPVTNDPVNHPAHYTAGAVECIDAIESATFGLQGGRAYSTGAAIKYLWRWSRKGGAEDLRKAEWYVRRLIAAVELEGNEIGEAESAG